MVGEAESELAAPTASPGRFLPAGLHDRGRGAYPRARGSVRLWAVRSSQLGAGIAWLEARMTKNRDFKRLVRARAAKTGQSYQLSRRIVTGSGSVPEGSLLAHIDGPSDLRHLSYPQLSALAGE